MAQGDVCCYEEEILRRYNKNLSSIISIQENQYNGTITICLSDGDRIFLTPRLHIVPDGITAKIKIEHIGKDDFCKLKSKDGDQK
jgi:hypothetical protein